MLTQAPDFLSDAKFPDLCPDITHKFLPADVGSVTMPCFHGFLHKLPGYSITLLCWLKQPVCQWDES
jgi:hypothetical protein